MGKSTKKRDPRSSVPDNEPLHTHHEDESASSLHSDYDNVDTGVFDGEDEEEGGMDNRGRVEDRAKARNQKRLHFDNDTRGSSSKHKPSPSFQRKFKGHDQPSDSQYHEDESDKEVVKKKPVKRQHQDGPCNKSRRRKDARDYASKMLQDKLEGKPKSLKPVTPDYVMSSEDDTDPRPAFNDNKDLPTEVPQVVSTFPGPDHDFQFRCVTLKEFLKWKPRQRLNYECGIHPDDPRRNELVRRLRCLIKEILAPYRVKLDRSSLDDYTYMEAFLMCRVIYLYMKKYNWSKKLTSQYIQGMLQDQGNYLYKKVSAARKAVMAACSKGVRARVGDDKNKSDSDLGRHVKSKHQDRQKGHQYGSDDNSVKKLRRDKKLAYRTKQKSSGEHRGTTYEDKDFEGKGGYDPYSDPQFASRQHTKGTWELKAKDTPFNTSTSHFVQKNTDTFKGKGRRLCPPKAQGRDSVSDCEDGNTAKTVKPKPERNDRKKGNAQASTARKEVKKNNEEEPADGVCLNEMTKASSHHRHRSNMRTEIYGGIGAFDCTSSFYHNEADKFTAETKEDNEDGSRHIAQLQYGATRKRKPQSTWTSPLPKKKQQSRHHQEEELEDNQTENEVDQHRTRVHPRSIRPQRSSAPDARVFEPRQSKCKDAHISDQPVQTQTLRNDHLRRSTRNVSTYNLDALAQAAEYHPYDQHQKRSSKSNKRQ
ncbi:hypothetical protein BJ508DRAFT_336685 [Ascobolus immersus RN42]|uniref:Uncharacterized protein n=1 Tax=Ascobolus immersus RN42 TaxID=1160509 RepID=A0A3N4HAF9_ASCIM|nr:hypothetical protein BJ508DRAFT_336685 [Ascobolus immersus RN42]